MVDLDRLRAIGWTHWNPIGLAGPPHTPADEYDVYLVGAADMLARGHPPNEVAAYLTRRVEVDMRMAPADRGAALATALAITALLDGG